MGLLDLIDKLITEHGSAGVLREHLLFLRTQLEQLEKENQRLQKENAALKKQENKLKTQLEAKTATEDFVKHRGMLFLRLPDGKIQDEVYCPKCRHPMSSFESFLPFDCEPCRVTAGFTEGDLARIIAEIG